MLGKITKITKSSMTPVIGLVVALMLGIVAFATRTRTQFALPSGNELWDKAAEPIFDIDYDLSLIHI